MMEAYIRKRIEEKKILLMTHIVIGYPSLKASYDIVKTMVSAGVDLMELQIPFSEPIADGPVILKANQKALEKGISVKECLAFSKQVAEDFDIPFLLMTYYNILFKYGVTGFIETMAANHLHGTIIPDLPYEEGEEYLAAMKKRNLAPIFIFAPTTSGRRMQKIASYAGGFIYCVARKGVTGQQTDFSTQIEEYMERCRKATDLPLALGFGVKDRTDIDFLTGTADIAVIGTQTIRVVDEQGVDAVGDFIAGLR
jgi:tryptophan synthase alpha chain